MKELSDIAKEFVTSHFGVPDEFFYSTWEFINSNFDKISSLASSPNGMKSMEGVMSFGGTEEKGAVKAILIFADGFKELPLKGDFSDIVSSIKSACDKYHAEEGLTREILKKVSTLENRIAKFMKPEMPARAIARGKERGEDYEIYLYKEKGIGASTIQASKSEVDKAYLANKGDYDIFVYTRSVYSKRRDERTRKLGLSLVELDQRMYVLLVLFLKYKDSSLNVFALHKKAWEHVPKDYDGRLDYKRTMEYLKSAVSELKAKLNVDALEIKKIRNSEGYICSGDFKFCVIIDQSQSDKYNLSDFDIKDAD